jgi:protein-arginine deiminase
MRYVALCLLLAACESAAPPTGVLLSDRNRDGVVDDGDRADPSDAAWSAAGGALFLANLDDDDGDGVADSADERVNGADDELDLARIRFAAWPGAGSEARATLEADGPLAQANVRVFSRRADGWHMLRLPATIERDDLRAGLELGIEALSFAGVTDAGEWDGYVSLRLSLNDGDAQLGQSSTRLRVAPFVMLSTLSSIGTLWDVPLGDSDSLAFGDGTTALAGKASAQRRTADTDDQWAEDWWQIGHTEIPAANATSHGMLVTQRSAQPDRDAGAFAKKQLGKDIAFVWPRTDDAGQRDDLGYSMDSFGDHDVLPPYDNGDRKYPLGRILIGGNDQHHPDAAVRAFYEAQQAQTVIEVDTSFLEVGHVDEIMTYVPAATPRGWKLLVASPRLARDLLTSWSAAGHGGATMFAGQSWYDFDGNTFPADTSIDALLADAEIAAANVQAQAGIDAALAIVRAEVGLADDDIIEMPFLFERYFDGREYHVTAHMVGTVNLRVLDGSLGIPKPHGPIIDGVDALEADLDQRLGSATNHVGADGKGMPIVYIEDWADYHTLEGEVHCGSNVMARDLPRVAWWEAGR